MWQPPSQQHVVVEFLIQCLPSASPVLSTCQTALRITPGASCTQTSKASKTLRSPLQTVWCMKSAVSPGGSAFKTTFPAYSDVQWLLGIISWSESHREENSDSGSLADSFLKMYSEAEDVIQKEFKNLFTGRLRPPAFRYHRGKLKENLHALKQNRKYHVIRN